MTKPGNLIIAGGVFILVIFTGTWLLSAGVSEKADMVDAANLEAYNNTFNNFEKYNTEMGTLLEKTTSTTGASSDTSVLGQAIDFINNLINSGWTTLKLLWGSFGFIHATFVGLSAVFGIPEWLITLVISLLAATFIFGLLTVIFGKEVIGK